MKQIFKIVLLPTVGREYFIDCAITDVVLAQQKLILANKRHKHSNPGSTSREFRCLTSKEDVFLFLSERSFQ